MEDKSLDFMVNDSVKDFVFDLHQATRCAQSAEEVRGLYRISYREICDKYFDKAAWPDARAISSQCLGDDGRTPDELFHATPRQTPTPAPFPRRHEAVGPTTGSAVWRAYLDLFDKIPSARRHAHAPPPSGSSTFSTSSCTSSSPSASSARRRDAGAHARERPTRWGGRAVWWWALRAHSSSRGDRGCRRATRTSLPRSRRRPTAGRPRRCTGTGLAAGACGGARARAAARRRGRVGERRRGAVAARAVGRTTSRKLKVRALAARVPARRLQRRGQGLLDDRPRRRGRAVLARAHVPPQPVLPLRRARAAHAQAKRDAAQTFAAALAHVARLAAGRARLTLAGGDQAKKMQDRMLALLAISLVLAPAMRRSIDETTLSMLAEKYQDKHSDGARRRQHLR